MYLPQNGVTNRVVCYATCYYQTGKTNDNLEFPTISSIEMSDNVVHGVADATKTRPVRYLVFNSSHTSQLWRQLTLCGSNAAVESQEPHEGKRDVFFNFDLLKRLYQTPE